MKLPIPRGSHERGTPVSSETVYADMLAGMPGYQPPTPRERPINLPWAIIQRILLGAQSEFRLPIDPQPRFNGHEWFWNIDNYAESKNQNGWLGAFPRLDDFLPALAGHSGLGKVGDRLWVREKHEFLRPRVDWLNDNKRVDTEGGVKFFASTQERGSLNPYVQPLDFNPVYNKVRSATQLPRFASRIDLQITHLRAEQLLDLSEDGVQREGFTGKYMRNYKDGSYTEGEATPARARQAYLNYWDYLHPKFPSASNPFIFVVGFKATKLPETYEDMCNRVYPDIPYKVH
jgi:hypothetical protein